jgi:hypothetical protein
MIKMKFLLATILAISIFSISCKKDKKTVSEQETLNTRIKNIEYEIISEKGSEGLKITNISYDTLELYNDTKGLQLSFNIEASAKAFDSVAFKGFNSYFIDLTCLSDQGKTYSHRNEIFKDEKKKRYLHTHKECFISHPTDRSLKISFPYRMLQLQEGEQIMTINIEAFPANFEDDSSSLDYKLLNKISNEARASISMKIKVKAPKLYKASFTVHKFKLNTKVVKPEKFDFAMGGSGYPDLFWEVYCGNDYIYYSPVIKNKIEYNKKYSSSTFFCTKDDIINLAVVDYDNGPFNTQDDIIEKWHGKIEELKSGKDTLQMGNLEYFVFETNIE